MTEELKYVVCPDCDGSGEQMEAHQRPWGYSEVHVECKYCEGAGQFEEGDYLVMKLAGIHGYV
jgi:DnaJ-class molecular chaperone